MASLTCGCGVGSNDVRCRWHAQQQARPTPQTFAPPATYGRTVGRAIDSSGRRAGEGEDFVVLLACGHWQPSRGDIPGLRESDCPECGGKHERLVVLTVPGWVNGWTA